MGRSALSVSSRLFGLGKENRVDSRLFLENQPTNSCEELKK